MQISDQLIEHLMIAARGIAWDKGVTVSEAEIARQHTRQVLEAALSAAEPVMYVSERQLASCVGTYVPSRKTAEGLFQLALYRAPPAPSVAVKALQELHAAEHAKLGEMLLDKSEDGQSKANWQGGRVNGIGAAISALSAQVQDVEGWQLVPKEPTQEMLDACGPKPKHWDATPSSRRVRESADRMRREDYKTMLAAAPAKQEGGHE